MYFSGNLETCTIGWVSFCEGGVGVGNVNPEKRLFYSGRMRRDSPPPPWPPAPFPPGGDPSPSAPGQTAQHRQQGRPCQMQSKAHTPGRCTGLHSIPDRRAVQIVPVACAGGRGVCPAKCTISGDIFILIYICIFCVKPLTTQI